MAATVSTGFLIFDILFVLVGALLALFVYFKHAYQYWRKKGVPYLEPTFPVGNNTFFLPKSSTFAGEAKIWYDELKRRGHKFGGVYSFSRSVLVLVDPDYIRDVLSQDFSYFADRDFYSNEKHDPLSAHLFNIKNPSWKPLRQKLTPTFTSGKMKMMFDSLLTCSNNMIDYLEKCEKMGDDVVIREVLSCFTTDVIGSVAFGIDCNSFTDPRGEFKTQGREFFSRNLAAIIKGLFIRSFPELCEKYGVPSFDTSSTLMTYALYELARNQDIQEKVREEINNVLRKYKGEITYEAIQEMTYLKQTLDETSRIHPPVISLARICTKNYQLKNTDVVIEKGTPVVVSTIGLGRDPQLFPDPLKFDPDRFSHDEVANRHPYIHIPFGEGPRNCIGLRFGLMQSKIGLVRVLSNFKVKISPKTKMPLVYDEKLFLLKEVDQLYLNIEKI